MNLFFSSAIDSSIAWSASFRLTKSNGECSCTPTVSFDASPFASETDGNSSSSSLCNIASASRPRDDRGTRSCSTSSSPLSFSESACPSTQTLRSASTARTFVRMTSTSRRTSLFSRFAASADASFSKPAPNETRTCAEKHTVHRLNARETRSWNAGPTSSDSIETRRSHVLHA